MEPNIAIDTIESDKSLKGFNPKLLCASVYRVDPPLVLHMPTSWWPTSQLVTYVHASAEVGLCSDSNHPDRRRMRYHWGTSGPKKGRLSAKNFKKKDLAKFSSKCKNTKWTSILDDSLLGMVYLFSSKHSWSAYLAQMCRCAMRMCMVHASRLADT